MGIYNNVSYPKVGLLQKRHDDKHIGSLAKCSDHGCYARRTTVAIVKERKGKNRKMKLALVGA